MDSISYSVLSSASDPEDREEELAHTFQDLDSATCSIISKKKWHKTRENKTRCVMEVDSIMIVKHPLIVLQNYILSWIPAVLKMR